MTSDEAISDLLTQTDRGQVAPEPAYVTMEMGRRSRRDNEPNIVTTLRGSQIDSRKRTKCALGINDHFQFESCMNASIRRTLAGV